MISAVLVSFILLNDSQGHENMNGRHFVRGYFSICHYFFFSVAQLTKFDTLKNCCRELNSVVECVVNILKH